MLAFGAASANASLLSPVSTFGSPGSGAGQLNTPGGVAIQESSGNVFIADSANARVDEFGRGGHFIAAFGWGVADGKARAEVCSSSCQAGIPGSGPGQFSSPTSIAFGVPGGPSAGKVFVGDSGNNVVDVFDAGGGFIRTIDGTTTPQGHFQSLAGISVDQSGNLWTVDAFTDNVDEFNSQGNFVQQWYDTFGSTLAIAVDSTHNAVYLIRGTNVTERFTLTGGNETVIDPPGDGGGSGLALAVDRTTGSLYVDHGGDVAIYNPSADRVDSLTLTTSNSLGLAVRSTGKLATPQLYASDSSADTVTSYSASPGLPLVTTESETGTGMTTATVSGTVVAAGHDTTCVFQYVSDADFQATGYTNATSVPCTPTDLGDSFVYSEVSANLTGLTPQVTYHFHVVATSSAGSTTGADQTFLAGPGDWTPFDRCPVDDPAMLATDGGQTTLGLCVASNSTNGTAKFGNLTTPTGNTNLQVGVIVNGSTGTTSVVTPPGGGLIAAPIQIMVGSSVVTATVESAGTPSSFNPTTAIGVPVITLPIKIQLESTTLPLGPSCFIGSDQNPIVLNPAWTDLSNASFKFEDFNAGGNPDGSVGPYELIQLTGGVQGDSTFAVPGATGCGTNDSLDAAVNGVAGLPSPSGNNNLVLDDASSNVMAGLHIPGQQLAADWHAMFG